MKAYIITSGAIFGLLTIAHLARIVMEGWRLASDFPFMLLTLASAALCLWAWRALKQVS